MSDVVLKWVGWRLGYEGRPGWPAKDLTQKELDDRGLDKARMLAYRPKLYEEVTPEVAEVKEVEPDIAEVKEAEPEIQVLVEPKMEEVKPAQKREKRAKEEAAPLADSVIDPGQEQKACSEMKQ